MKRTQIKVTHASTYLALSNLGHMSSHNVLCLILSSCLLAWYVSSLQSSVCSVLHFLHCQLWHANFSAGAIVRFLWTRSPCPTVLSLVADGPRFLMTENPVSVQVLIPFARMASAKSFSAVTYATLSLNLSRAVSFVEPKDTMCFLCSTIIFYSTHGTRGHKVLTLIRGAKDTRS